MVCCIGRALALAATMNPSPWDTEMLDQQHFLIKKQIASLKTADAYDIFNPKTGKQVGQAREVVSRLVKVLRLFISKKMMPLTIEVREHPEESLVFYLRKPVGFVWETVDVFDAEGHQLGYCKCKLLALGSGFWVYDKNGKQFAEVKGNWTGWEFRFLTPDGHELGTISKKWSGLLQELFTSADNYVVSIAQDLAEQPIAKMLLLAAALAIDAVYYEGRRGGSIGLGG